MDYFKDAAVCVTGAGGSIGSEICRRLLTQRPKMLTLLSLTEAGLYNIERELRPIANLQDCELRPVLGSVTDGNLVRELMQDTDVVIHAAAHKHVPICERNPLAAIENNIGGTYILLVEAALARVKQFVLISSDKAVKPSSVMGATKRAAELLMRDGQPTGSPIRVTTVRFGNVLDSAGSVLPLWREQLAKGLPITLTDERCERYFMSIPEAVDLVLSAAALNSDGTFVLDMGKPKKLIDMAWNLIREYRYCRDILIQPGEADPIKIVGLRPGEKITEELTYGAEQLRPTKADRVMRIAEGPGRTLSGADFNELMGYVITRKTDLALKKLWEIVS